MLESYTFLKGCIAGQERGVLVAEAKKKKGK
jgi:hypothetical protein